MKVNTKIILGVAAVAGAYWLWKKKNSKPHPSTFRNGEECVANGYFWGGTGIVAACFQNQEEAYM